MSLPRRLGRLERVERLGVGGFATVWLYHDYELDSDVAVKALAENWSQRLDVRERFLEEARILRRADSDHIVRVYDIGEVDGTPYFVMSYADRGSLAGLLEAGRPLPVDQVGDPTRAVGACGPAAGAGAEVASAPTVATTSATTPVRRTAVRGIRWCLTVPSEGRRWWSTS